jgi:hypothetical protein
MRGATEVVGQIRIADVPRQHHAAHAQGNERERTIVRPRSFQVILEHFDHLPYYFLIGGLDLLPAPLHVRGHPDQRAAAVAIVEVLAREIGVDYPLRAGLRDRTRFAPLLPGRGRLLAQELPDGRRIELIFAPEMPIEAAVGEAGMAHDLLDRHTGIALAVEESPGAFEDFLAGVALVLW